MVAQPGRHEPPESHRRQRAKRGHPQGEGPARRLVWTYALALGAFQGAAAVLSPLLASRFGVTERTVGWAFLFTEAVAVVARAVLLAPRCHGWARPACGAWAWCCWRRD
ncbi:MAG: hypothetical protein ACXU86_06610 [Archangium sp.]